MDKTWNDIIPFIGTAITVIGFVYAYLRNFKIDINAHIDRLEKKIDSQSAHTDKLYEMFIDLLKEVKKS